MPKYACTAVIEAEQFTISDEQKAETKKGQVIDQKGIQIRKGGDNLFNGLVRIGSEVKSVEEGDYLIMNGGAIQKVVAKAEFEKNYKEVKEAKKA